MDTIHRLRGQRLIYPVESRLQTRQCLHSLKLDRQTLLAQECLASIAVCRWHCHFHEWVMRVFVEAQPKNP